MQVSFNEPAGSGRVNRVITSGERQVSNEGSPLKKGERHDGEFEGFLAEIAPALEQSVGRLGVAGHLGLRPGAADAAKTIVAWPDLADRVIEEFR